MEIIKDLNFIEIKENLVLPNLSNSFEIKTPKIGINRN